MMSHLLLVSCLLLSLPCSLALPDHKELLFVHILYRHGDRSPIFTYPTDVYQESHWPQGFGYLSQMNINEGLVVVVMAQLGLAQHFTLGQYFRSRYIKGDPYHLLNSTYNRYQIRVRSTSVDRTLMSAYSNLAGMFSSSTSPTSNGQLPLQPIPVYSIHPDDDFLRVESCPKGFASYNQEPRTGERALRIASENLDFLAFVAEQAGLDGSEPTLHRVSRIGDPLFCEVCHRLPLPDWVEKVWHDGRRVLDKVLDLHGVVFQLKHSAPGVNSLLGGGILNDITTRMTNKINGTIEPDNLKLYVYSAHDTTVAALMAAMNVFNNVQPPYTASIMIELFNISGQFAVEVWYKNDSTREPYQLTVPGCNSTCPLDQFVEHLRDNIVADWQTECGLQTNNGGDDLRKSQNMAPIIAVSCIVILTIASLLMIILVLLRTRHKTHGYQRLEGFAVSK